MQSGAPFLGDQKPSVPEIQIYPCLGVTVSSTPEVS